MPPDSPDPEADAELLRLIYHAHASPSNVVQMLADYSEADWQFVLDRWEALPTRNQEKDWQRKRENVPSVASYQPGKKMALRYSEQPAKSTSLF